MAVGLDPKPGARRRAVALFAISAAVVACLLARPLLWTRAEPYVKRYVVQNCHPCRPGDDICRRWGYDALMRSRSYVGSARALDDFAARLRPGSDVKIGILGGSFSAGHDLEHPETDAFPAVLRTELEQRTGARVTIHNGAIGAVGSVFFSACWNLMLSGEEDLIIIELAVNDPSLQLINRSIAFLFHTLLSLKKRPALLLLDTYSPAHDHWYDAGVSTNAVAEYFDIPVVSHRNALYHLRHRHPERAGDWWIQNRFFTQGHHPTPKGHALIAGLLLSLIHERSCLAEDNEHGIDRVHANWEGEAFSGVPNWMPWHNINETISHQAFDPSTAPASTLCQSAAPGSSHLVLSPKSKGFSVGNWKDKTFYVGKEVGDVAVFEHVAVTEMPRLFYWRSRTLGFGGVRCWLGDNTEDVRHFDGYWDNSINMPAEGLLHLPRGTAGSPVKLSCKIIAMPKRPEGVKSGNEFRIAAIAW